MKLNNIINVKYKLKCININIKIINCNYNKLNEKLYIKLINDNI